MAYRIAAAILTVAVASLAFAGTPAADAGGGCHNGVFSDEANTQVELSKNCFEPTVVRVAAGGEVTWTSSDPEAHTVTGAANTWGNEKEIYNGQSVTYRFDETGVFPYFCYFHPSMVGAVVVGDGQPVATSSTDGGVKAVSAEIPGGDESASDDEAIVEESGDGNSDVPLILGIGALGAVVGFGGAVALRRRIRA